MIAFELPTWYYIKDMKHISFSNDYTYITLFGKNKKKRKLPAFTMSFSLLKLYQQPIKLQVSLEVGRDKQMGIEKEREEIIEKK